jgi:hypothetical protein
VTTSLVVRAGNSSRAQPGLTHPLQSMTIDARRGFGTGGEAGGRGLDDPGVDCGELWAGN